MITYTYKNHGLVFEEQWFTNGEVLPVKKGTDFLNVFAIDKRDDHDVGYYRKQYSLITNLSDDDESIYNSFRKNVKYEIRRSEKDGDYFKVYIGEEIDEDMMRSFGDVFEKMYSEKGITCSYNYKLAKKCIDCNCLVYSVGYHCHTPLVYHSYIIDDNNARLYQSCSLFRDGDKREKQIIGGLNRALHWHDIKFFKQKGMKKYDWGGVSDPDNPNGIDLFKIGFGGEPIEYYNLSFPVSLKGKLYYFLKTR